MVAPDRRRLTGTSTITSFDGCADTRAVRGPDADVVTPRRRASDREARGAGLDRKADHRLPRDEAHLHDLLGRHRAAGVNRPRQRHQAAVDQRAQVGHAGRTRADRHPQDFALGGSLLPDRGQRYGIEEGHAQEGTAVYDPGPRDVGVGPVRIVAPSS